MNITRTIKTMQRRGAQTTDARLSGLANAQPVTPPEAQVVSDLDHALQQFTGRDLVRSGEVVDFLLDLRNQLVLDSAVADLCDTAP